MTRPIRFNRLLSSDLTLLVREWELRGRPRQSAIDWSLEAWVKEFAEFESQLRELKIKNLGLLNRTFVREVIQNSIAKQETEFGFLVCMIWGFGSRGYAQHRTRKIFSSDNFSTSLQETITHLKDKNLAKAFESLITNGPEGLGSSFGTKYLYFANPDETQHPPIIVDALVAEAINDLTMRRVDPLRLNSTRYLELIAEFSQAAEFLELRPEVLEEILFDWALKRSSNAGWSSMTAGLRSSKSKKAWVMALATDLTRKGEVLQIERSHPGDAQYDCIRLSSKNKYEIEFNANGNIHMFEPSTSHYGWEIVDELGLLEVSKRLRQSTEKFERAFPNHNSNSLSWLSRALLGKAEFPVDDFDSFFIVSDEQRKSIESIDMSLRSRDLENSFVLLNKGNVQGILLPWKGIVLKLSGEKIEVESDCYMPVEEYYGDDQD